MNYERVFSTDIDLCYVAVMYALGMSGFSFPKLFIAKENLGYAVKINQQLGHILNIELVKEPRDADEWWIEYDGRCVGSPGA